MATVTNKRINDYLMEQGVSPVGKGYGYLFKVIRAVLDGKVDRYVMKTAYEYVSLQEQTRPVYVENAIRRALHKVGAINQPVVTNNEFICKAINDLMFEIDPNYVPC